MEKLEFHDKKHYGYTDNKNIIINKIYGIKIDHFRGIENVTLELGDNITLISGRNGTMKSTLMGLISHPFSSKENDIFNKRMETKLSEVFKLSKEKDKKQYSYNLNMSVGNNENLEENVKISYRQNGNRHRIVVSGHDSGDGNFSLPSVYLNLKRLYPLVELNNLTNNIINYSQEEKNFISTFFEKVLLKTEFNQFDSFNGKIANLEKNPLGPLKANYDVNSISSGEDNMGTIVNVLISFMRIYNKNHDKKKLTGLLSIDEFEASLHPISQFNLFNFLLKWSKKYNVQIILSTHSLFLLEEALKMEDKINNNTIKLNFITNRFESKTNILKNPSYNIAREELILRCTEPDKKIKVKILCEDDVAEKFIKKIIGTKISKFCSFQCKTKEAQDGVSYKLLAKLVKNYPVLLKERMTIVIADADVEEKELKNKEYDKWLIIPSKDKLPLEKELVKYILSLNPDNKFFKNNNKTQEMFRQEFSENSIPLTTNEIYNNNTNYYKNWFESVPKRELNKYITHLINDENNKEIYDNFKDDFNNMVNSILKENGLPTIS